jgi:hypothetical protein
MEMDKKFKGNNFGLDEDDDEIPVGDEYIAQEEKEAPESGDEEVYPLGNTKKPGTAKPKPVVSGNGYSGAPVAWMVPNFKLADAAVAHIAMVPYGFDANGDPKPGFHNHVLKTLVESEENLFFTSRNIGAESLVNLVNRDGDLISIPAMTSMGKDVDKMATGIWIVTRYEQSPPKLETLFNGFLAALNTLQWNGKLLNQRIRALTPEHLILPQNGLGPYVGQIGCEQIIKRFYDDFRPRNRWGKDHRELLAQLWNKGGWTLDNATFFGAPLTWMTETERAKYAEQVANRNNNGV